MLEGAKAIHPAVVGVAAGNEANVWQAALLLVAQHGADAAEAARNHAQRAEAVGETLESGIWQWIIVAVEHLLGELSATDLLYATVLAPPSTAEVSAEAA